MFSPEQPRLLVRFRLAWPRLNQDILVKRDHDRDHDRGGRPDQGIRTPPDTVSNTAIVTTAETTAARDIRGVGARADAVPGHREPGAAHAGEVGAFTGREAEITSGVGVGDRVIVFPSDKVRDGARVSPRSKH